MTSQGSQPSRRERELSNIRMVGAILGDPLALGAHGLDTELGRSRQLLICKWPLWTSQSEASSHLTSETLNRCYGIQARAMLFSTTCLTAHYLFCICVTSAFRMACRMHLRREVRGPDDATGAWPGGTRKPCIHSLVRCNTSQVCLCMPTRVRMTGCNAETSCRNAVDTHTQNFAKVSRDAHLDAREMIRAVKDANA